MLTPAPDILLVFESIVVDSPSCPWQKTGRDMWMLHIAVRTPDLCVMHWHRKILSSFGQIGISRFCLRIVTIHMPFTKQRWSPCMMICHQEGIKISSLFQPNNSAEATLVIVVVSNDIIRSTNSVYHLVQALRSEASGWIDSGSHTTSLA